MGTPERTRKGATTRRDQLAGASTSGYPGTGPYAGRGKQHQQARWPRCRKVLNARYLAWGNHRCGKSVRGRESGRRK